MKPDPILEELWRAKDDLAREADYDIDRIFAELRTAEPQYPGALIRSAEDLQQYVAEQERRPGAALVFNEKPAPISPHPG